VHTGSGWLLLLPQNAGGTTGTGKRQSTAMVQHVGATAIMVFIAPAMSNALLC